LPHRLTRQTNRLLAITYVVLVAQTVVLAGSFLLVNYLSAVESRNNGYTACLRRTSERWLETARAEAQYYAWVELSDRFSEDRKLAPELSKAANRSFEEFRNKEVNAPPLPENQVKFCEKAWPEPKFFGA
jgi:hypothetical protein